MIRSCYEGKWRSEPLGLAKASGGTYIRSNILTAGMAKTARISDPLKVALRLVARDHVRIDSLQPFLQDDEGSERGIWHVLRWACNTLDIVMGHWIAECYSVSDLFPCLLDFKRPLITFVIELAAD
jgi:hypothetical protein